MENKKILIKAIAKYGEKQLDIAQEECAELIQAISKWKRYGDTNAKLNVIEEVADVTIMLEQIKIMFGITEEILQDEIDFKLDILAKKMEEEENE